MKTMERMKKMKKWMMIGVIAAMAMSVQAGGTISWTLTPTVASDFAAGMALPEYTISPRAVGLTIFVILDEGANVANILTALGNGSFDGNNAGILGRSEVFGGLPTAGTYGTQNVAVNNGTAYDIAFLYLYDVNPLLVGMSLGTITHSWEMTGSGSFMAGGAAGDIPFSSGTVVHGKYTIAPGDYAVPEPMTVGLALAGIALLVAQRKRKS